MYRCIISWIVLYRSTSAVRSYRSSLVIYNDIFEKWGCAILNIVSTNNKLHSIVCCCSKHYSQNIHIRFLLCNALTLNFNFKAFYKKLKYNVSTSNFSNNFKKIRVMDLAICIERLLSLEFALRFFNFRILASTSTCSFYI